MCVIVYRPAGKSIPLYFFEKAIAANKDGFGVMYYEDGAVQVIKKAGPNKLEEFLELYDGLADKNLGIHFRLRTHGDDSVDNSHPYKILSKADGDPHDAFLMHNGVIQGTGAVYGKGQSDTAAYIEKVIAPILKASPGLLASQELMGLIARDVGTSNKLLLVHSAADPFAWTFNTSSGHEKWGCWFSNAHHVHEPVLFQGGGGKYQGPFTGSTMPTVTTKNIELVAPTKGGGLVKTTLPFDFQRSQSRSSESSFSRLTADLLASKLDNRSVRELLLTSKDSPLIQGNFLEKHHLRYLTERDLEEVVKHNPGAVVDLLFELQSFRFKEPPEFRSKLMQDSFSASA